MFDFLLVFIALELAAFCGYRLLRQEQLVPVDVYFHTAAALGLSAHHGAYSIIRTSDLQSQALRR